MDATLVIVTAVVVLVIVALLLPVFQKARKVNLTEVTDEKPEWMQSTPPAETVAATKAEGEGVNLYNQDAGEKLAAPFAEQIEDIVRSKVEADAFLRQYKIDLGTAADGGLEIWVNGEMYPDVNSLPDERLRQVFQEAIQQWDKG
jgi:hypothetical protein